MSAPAVADPLVSSLRINGQRLWDSLMRLAEIGATPKGGVCRLALTDLDRQGRDFFVAQARAAGCSIRIDAVGNLFARRAGLDDSLSAIATGSHIDTQPTGGKFDGNYGVLAGLEVVRTLNDAQIRTQMQTNLCRCGTYLRIREAIHHAAAIAAGKQEAP